MPGTAMRAPQMLTPISLTSKYSAKPSQAPSCRSPLAARVPGTDRRIGQGLVISGELKQRPFGRRVVVGHLHRKADPNHVELGTGGRADHTKAFSHGDVDDGVRRLGLIGGCGRPPYNRVGVDLPAALDRGP